MQATIMRNLDRIRKQLNPARRKKITIHATALISEERTLQELRYAHKLTQKRMAEVLGIGQDSVSRLEQRSDLLISTLRGYVEAMGGRLSLIAEFPNQDPVVLAGLAAIESAKTDGCRAIPNPFRSSVVANCSAPKAAAFQTRRSSNSCSNRRVGTRIPRHLSRSTTARTGSPGRTDERFDPGLVGKWISFESKS